MKRCVEHLSCSLFFLIGAALLLPGSAQATTVTFDDMGFVNFDDVTTQYSALGVTFQGYVSSNPVALEVVDHTVFMDNTPPSPPMSLSNFYNNDKYARADTMVINFLAPVSNIELDYNGAGSYGSTTAFNLYDFSSNTLVGSFTVASATDTDYHHAAFGGTDIGRLEILAPQSGWGHYIDNLSFQAGPVVPVPGAAALVLVGLGALRVGRRFGRV